MRKLIGLAILIFSISTIAAQAPIAGPTFEQAGFNPTNFEPAFPGSNMDSDSLIRAIAAERTPEKTQVSVAASIPGFVPAFPGSNMDRKSLVAAIAAGRRN